MNIDAALLEAWLRRYYFATTFDLGSSGVESFSFAELRHLTGITSEELDDIAFNDSRSFGDDALRQSIADRWGNGDPSFTMATHGSSEAIFLMMHSLLRAGDEVIVLDPVYHALCSIPTTIGCRVNSWTLHPDEGFEPLIHRLRTQATTKTRMIIVNFPHNPTGATITKEVLDEIIEIASNTGAYLFWDSAFSELTYDSRPLPDPTKYYKKAVSVGTLSKAYGLPGLRVGWCIAEPHLLERCLTLRDNSTLHLSPLVEFIARRAIDNGDLLVDNRRRQAKKNLSVLKGWMEEHKGLVNWKPPQAGASAFVELVCIRDIEKFCSRAAEEEDVLLVPGSCFGQERYIRLGFGGASGKFAEGLARVSKMMERYVC